MLVTNASLIIYLDLRQVLDILGQNEPSEDTGDIAIIAEVENKIHY